MCSSLRLSMTVLKSITQQTAHSYLQALLIHLPNVEVNIRNHICQAAPTVRLPWICTSAPASLSKWSPYAGPSAGAEVARFRKWHGWCLLDICKPLGQQRVWRLSYVFVVGFPCFNTPFHNFTSSSTDIHRISSQFHRNFDRIFDWSTYRIVPTFSFHCDLFEDMKLGEQTRWI